MKRLLFVAFLTLAWIAALAGVAAAHAGFVSSSPEPGATLGTTPGVVSLGFSEPLNMTLSRATVLAPTGTRFQGRVTGAAQISITLSTNAQGVYEVDWTTVSLVDGHTLHGSFMFGVGVSVSAVETGGTASGPTAGDLFIATARAIEDTALLAAVGMLLVRRLSQRVPPLPWIHPRPVIGLAVALVGGLLVVAGETLVAIPARSTGGAVSYLTTGLPGVARLLRPIFELIALLIALWRPRLAWAPLAVALTALAAAGHAAAVHPSLWGVSVEALHLITTGLWAGGILALALQRPPEGWMGDEGRAMLGRFTPVALGAFAGSSTTGILRAIQELGSVRALYVSTYGVVLLLKILLVVLMVQLSILAWRRLFVKPRIEAGVAILVVTAAALLAAFPVPPARLVDSDARPAQARGSSALPKQGDLTLGGDTGQFLVGLTVRRATNEVFVFLRGPGGDPATATRAVRVEANHRSLAVMQCGPTCRVAPDQVHPGDTLDITVEGQGGGTARFHIPDRAPPANALLARALARMHVLRSYRIDEMLTSGGPIVRATYAFVSPHSFESEVSELGSRSEVVWIGGTRYLRDIPGSWQVERGGPAPTVPTFVWDSFTPYTAVRMTGHETIEGVHTTVVAFFGGNESSPIWFRLWIDDRGLVVRAEMRAEGHFMNDRYYAFDTSIQITAPVGHA